MGEPELLGVVTAPSGIVVVLDMGLMWMWSGDQQPVMAAGRYDPETVAAANSKVDFTNLPVGPVGTTAAVHIYRFDPADAQFKLVGTVNNPNLANPNPRTFTDRLGAAIDPTMNVGGAGAPDVRDQRRGVVARPWRRFGWFKRWRRYEH